MTINEAIDLSIQQFINETMFDEKRKGRREKKHKKEDEVDIKKGAIKKKNGGRGDFDVKTDRSTNPNLNKADNDALSREVDNGLFNVAGIAKKMYPDLTDNGAQSKLRKKIKHEKSDSGATYKLKRKEAVKLRKILRAMLGM